MKFGFIIDNRKCIGCHACTVACKSEHDVPLGVNRTWVKYVEKGNFPDTQRVFSVNRCNHCDDAPCVDICPVTALFTRSDGIVDFDNRRCIGCKACTQACPYDAIYIDPNLGTAAKCNYCAHRTEIGLEPACVNVCPTHAIISGDLENPQSEIAVLKSQQRVVVRKPEKGTNPKLFYIDGDQDTLVPTATETSNQYMWNSQVAGVGHFAPSVGSEEDEKAKQNWLEGENGALVLVPNDGDIGAMRSKARDVLKESARRIYDSPNKGIVWGWKVTAYMWTKAICAGAFLIPFFLHCFGLVAVPDNIQWIGVGVSLVFLGATGALLTYDLDKPFRFLYVLLRPQWKSWLVRGAYIILAYSAILPLWAFAKWRGMTGLEQFSAWAGIPLAIMTAIYTAFLFAQAKGRDFWQSTIFPIHMLAHAIMAGAAAFAIADLFVDGGAEWTEAVRISLILGIVLHLAVDAFELSMTHPTDDSRKTVQMIVRGQFAAGYWLGVVLIGNMIPFALAIVGGFGPMMVASLCTLAGIWIAEHIWVKAPQLIPLS